MRLPTPILVTATLALPALAQPAVTQADLLRRLTDLERLLRPPTAGERMAYFSSPDRRPGTDGWDVLAEMDGPGAILRLWVSEARGQVRFVLDGDVALETSFEGLLGGRRAPWEAPLVGGGRWGVFPVPFGRSARLEAKEGPAAYHVGALRFAPETQVARFGWPPNEATRQALEEAKRALTGGLSDKQIEGGQRLLPVAAADEIGPKQALAQALSGAGTVRALYVALTDATDPQEPGALHQCQLRVTVDGEATPSVDAPLLDFFGVGFDLLPFNSLMVGTDKALPVPLPERPRGQDRYMYCLWPMPYRDGLRIEIENRNASTRKIGLMLYLRVDTRPPAADALRFHARYAEVRRCRDAQYSILDVGGAGRFVGCVLNVSGSRREWWGGGAWQAWVDGAPQPLAVATGADAYVGDAGGWRPWTGALFGVTRGEPARMQSAYRWHVADDVPFHKAFRLTLENTQADVGGLHFGSVAYWYAAGEGPKPPS
ncbi:MAG: glycoside hydrolase family 172 protein [Planctomycetota bacterium]